MLMRPLIGELSHRREGERSDQRFWAYQHHGDRGFRHVIYGICRTGLSRFHGSGAIRRFRSKEEP
jgi:hypothetical protein